MPLNILEEHRASPEPCHCEVCGLENVVRSLRSETPIVAESPAIQATFLRVADFALADAPVMVLGESGTGKEIVARALHANGSRRSGPFVALNVAAVPGELLESELFGHVRGAFTGATQAKEGLLQAASGGTLFLDEVAEMPLPLQAKLLRAVQEGEVRRVGDTRTTAVDVRFVCATHRDLRAEVAAGRFREDLYFRLKVLTVRVPPLRERRDDILPLFRALNARERRPAKGLSPAAEAALLAYPWPGNVRELGNAVKHGCALARGGVIELAHLPEELQSGGAAPAAGVQAEGSPLRLEEAERAHVLRVLDRCGGSQNEAARVLGIGRTTLWRKLRAWGVALLLLLVPALASARGPSELTILSYHEIADPAEAVTPAYAVTPTNFLRQMDWLRNHGYRFVGVDDVLAARSGKRPLPPKAVLVTFDDAYQSVYEHAWPVLRMFRIPAVVSVVGSWLDQQDTVDLDGKQVPRKVLISWDALREMQRSGLVEVGSHSWDLHRGILANPQGNHEPAATTRQYLPAKGGREDEASYRRRIEADLSRSSAAIEKRTGKRPRVVTWPYGRYNATTAEAASRLGFQVGLTLLDGANRGDTPLLALRRLIVDGNLRLPDFAAEMQERERDVSDNDRPQSIAHVDLDAIYDPDPAQQERNLSHLLDRLQWLNVNTVYLQAFADPDGNGSADAVYFPNRRLPMRADLFNRVAWQIRTRTQVKRLYAWFPALAFELPASDPASRDMVTALPAAPGETAGRVDMGYKRLSPFSPRAREAIRELYEDLARSAPFDGLLFHDDLTLSDREDASPPALATYRGWGLPGSVEEIRRSDDLVGRWTIFKINALDDLAMELADVVRREHPGLVVGRNLYAQVVLKPRAEAWYAQAFDNSLARYDFTAIMAMPYMENAPDPDAFYRDLVAEVKARGAMKKVVFEIQAVDWRKGSTPLPSEEIAATLRTLFDLGVVHVGYYPDTPMKSHPDPAVIRRVLSQRPATVPAAP